MLSPFLPIRRQATPDGRPRGRLLYIVHGPLLDGVILIRKGPFVELLGLVGTVATNAHICCVAGWGSARSGMQFDKDQKEPPMNSALTTAITPAVRIAGVVTFVCSVAAAPLACGPVPAAQAQTGMYGDPAAAAPFWRQQHSGDCGEMAVADVVGQISGNEPTEQQITSVAETTPGVAGAGPIYRGGRTDTLTQNLPVLLAHYGVQSSLDHPRIAGLEQDLAQGHKVITPVDGPTLWNIPGRVSHAVVVTGIDPQAGVVHLNDSVKAGPDEQVPLATFEKAWGTTQNLAVVTS